VKTIIIKVTKKHIREGRMCSSSRCPISLALIDRDPDADPDVTDWVYFNLHGKSYEGRATKKIMAFFMAFDAGKRVKPQAFTLHVVGVKR
jgi:hypothetical protein